MSEYKPGDVNERGEMLAIVTGYADPKWCGEGAFFVTPEQARVAVNHGWLDDGPSGDFRIVRRGVGPVISSAPTPDHTDPARSPFDDMPTLAERQYRPPITQARVAAAFAKWAEDMTVDGGPWEEPHLNEAVAQYAQRLAAGLFKYLERDSQALTEGEGT